MARVLFFIFLAFLIFMALRIITHQRKTSKAAFEENDTNHPQAQAQEMPAEQATVQALLPCPLCAIHMPQTELAAHLKQVHNANP